MNSKLSTLLSFFVILYWNKTLREAFAANLQNHHGKPLSFCTSRCIYVSSCMSADLSERRLERVCLGDFRGCLATWIYDSGGWGGYQKPCGSWRRDWRDGERGVWCVNLQLIRSTSCSQAELSLQYVHFYWNYSFAFLQLELYHPI